MPEVDENVLDVPSNPEDDDMASLDENSYLHWKEDLYNHAAQRREGAEFFVEALRSAYMEGKVGYRESLALMNNPPSRAPGSIPEQK
jgi:hypothetical protein